MRVALDVNRNLNMQKGKIMARNMAWIVGENAGEKFWEDKYVVVDGGGLLFLPW